MSGLWILAALVGSAVIGMAVAQLFRKPVWPACVLGFLCGPIGWILIGIMPEDVGIGRPRRTRDVRLCVQCKAINDTTGLDEGHYECFKCGASFYLARKDSARAG